MNKGAGLAVLLAVSTAAMRLSSGGSPPTPSPAPHAQQRSGTLTPPTAPEAAPAGYAGGCTAYTPAPAEAKPVTYPEQHEYGGALSVIGKFFDRKPANQNDLAADTQPPLAVQYAIALVPDPHHTNLSLMTDRQMVSIQQAAQDEGYAYNSSWLPWSNDSQTYTGLDDQQLSSDLTSQREACPGILLFRKGATEAGPSSNDIFKQALVVLVVGEQPTGGINQNQWDNAIHWLSAQPAQTSGLRILGPTFSGSLVSLDRDLKSVAATSTLFKNIQVLSGSVSNCSSVKWFLHQKPAAGTTVSFGSFQENDDVHIYRFLSYIASQNVSAKDTAIISEDETAYGAHHDQVPNAADPCEVPYKSGNLPLRLYYPRDMSALRAQYQKESIFSSGESSADHQAHAILQDGAEAEGPSTSSADTVPNFSGPVTPLAQESILYGVVADLRAHHPMYLILRCTNPLDYLFLTRFFHRTYPEGRIVIVGQDLLLSREVDTTEFRGVLGLANYPLVPGDQHWSLLIDDSTTPHAHRVFESHVAQGTYLAARYTFDPKATPTQTQPLSFARKPNLSGYTDPYWLHLTGAPPDHPPTWLSVVGRDGFWPIATLNETTTPRGDLHTAPPSGMIKLVPGSLRYNLDPVTHRPLKPLPFSFPLSWYIFALGALLLLFYQLYGLYLHDRIPSSGLFSVFRPDTSTAQRILVSVSCLVVVLILLEAVGVSMALPSGQVLSDLHLFLIYTILAIALTFWLARFVHTRNTKTVNTAYWTSFAVFVVAYCFIWFLIHLDTAVNLPLFYRMGHITSGVSPILPVLFLSIGFYLWSWQAMAGNLLMSGTRPLLPFFNPAGQPTTPPLFRISSVMDSQIVRMAQPLSLAHEILFPPLIVVACSVFLSVRGLDLLTPLLTLESHPYTVLINFSLLVAFFLSMVETARLFNTWSYLRKLLVALSDLRLRRTFAHIRAVPSTSLWGVSGNVPRIQFEFFAQQLDAAVRLQKIIQDAAQQRDAPVHLQKIHLDPIQGLDDAVAYGQAFAQENADKLSNGPLWHHPICHPTNPSKQFIREIFSAAVSDVLHNILLPAWEKETSSLCIDATPVAADGSKCKLPDMTLSPEPVASAEEFVCLHYISYIQNILARMRTMILSLACLFVAVCFAISFYPFVPRTQIAVWMMIDLVFITATVIYVYSGMERDATLSYIANSQPGKIGSVFWIKIAAFLAGPVIGVLTTQFPSIADSVLGWLQPGLDAFKS